MFFLMDTKCINFHFAFQASLYTKTDNGMKIHIWETTMKRMSMRQQIMMLHFCIRKTIPLRLPGRSILCKTERGLPAKI